MGPQPGQKRRVRNHLRLWRARATKKALPPAGWALIQNKHRSYYTVDSAPDLKFRYPLPTAAEVPPEPEQLSWPPYLRFRAFRAYFKIFRVLISANPYLRPTGVSISDAEGEMVGALWLALDITGPPLVGRDCELIAISRGSSPNKPSLYRDTLAQNGGVYEFYNVLWIKREGHYMVREAVGKVSKLAWERQAVEEIDVELH
ncbi:hypothetical protein B0J12DRAFT_701592 [Macrophomina phaseolina]|uniref:Uncharacterized protein n=1 Tax=Macrophomina phaseolina TaxID=35725 RepID=A0ABQ8G7J2_9PEZI|nr:hypothetical protein B0J12DRAFT_701592 [Macrophomina phaseolina]